MRKKQRYSVKILNLFGAKDDGSNDIRVARTLIQERRRKTRKRRKRKTGAEESNTSVREERINTEKVEGSLNL